MMQEATSDAIATLQARYVQLREELENLLAQPEKNMFEVDRLVDDLERCQLDIKAALGVEGNNPNE